MSRSPSSKVRPVKRFRIGFLSILQIVLAVLIFLSANFLSSQYHRPFDLSDDLGFTLAPSTRRYLESEALQGREDPVRMIVAFRATSPIYDRVRPIAEEYIRLSQGKIELQLLDPVRANDWAEALSAEYSLTFNQDLVVIDARSAAQRQSGEGANHVHVVRLEDMVVYETDANNQRRVRGFLGEDALRAGLVAALEGKPRTMWLLADKSSLNDPALEGAWPVFSAAMVSQNILPERVQIAGTERIPEEVSTLAILAPQYDFTTEEIAVLEEYWNRPGSSLLVLTGPSPVPPRLRAFLRSHGVTVRDDRVLTVRHGSVQTAVVGRFLPGMSFTKDFWGTTTLLEGHTRSLEVREGAEDLLERQLHPYTILEANPDFWGETGFSAEGVTFDPATDHVPPPPPRALPGEPAPPLRGHALAAAVIRGSATDERFAAQTSRLVVISNAGFLTPARIRQANLDFLSSAANWLVEREALTGEGPHNFRLYKLPLLEPQVSFVNRANLLFLPLFFLLVAAMVWSARRA